MSMKTRWSIISIMWTILIFLCLLTCVHKVMSQDLIADPYIPKYNIPKIEGTDINKDDTLAIQLGAGVNVTQLFKKSFGMIDLVYANFDFVYQKEDFIFKHFALSTYNDLDSTQTAVMMMNIGYYHIGPHLGMETEIKNIKSRSNFLVGLGFANKYLSTGMFYRTDESLECASRFLYHYGNAQLSLVGTYNFQHKYSFILISIVRVFNIK